MSENGRDAAVKQEACKTVLSDEVIALKLPKNRQTQKSHYHRHNDLHVELLGIFDHLEGCAFCKLV